MTRPLSILLAALAAAAPAAAQCETWLPGPLDPTPDGASGPIKAALTWDPDGAGPDPSLLVVGGQFGSVNGVPTFGLAAWNTDHWFPLGPPLGGTVYALTVHNGSLVVGGTFPARVSRLLSGSWLPLTAPGTNNGDVFALAVHNGDLIAGGDFSIIDGVQAKCIARWNGTAWAPIGFGFSGAAGTSDPRVSALGVYNGALIAGGHFEMNGTTPQSNLAAWTGTTWVSLGGGVSGSPGSFRPEVFALRNHGSDLIVAGEFTTAGTTPASCVARWNGTNWQAMGAGFNTTVLDVAVHNGTVVAGGHFQTSGAASVKRVARWNGAGWEPIGGGIGGIGHWISALAVRGTTLFAGGTFETQTGAPGNNLVRLGVTAWEPCITLAWVNAFANWGSRVIAAGQFADPGPVSSSPVAYHVGAWSGGESMEPMGAGFDSGANAVEVFTHPGPVPTTEIVCGGSFIKSGTVTLNRVARWVDDPVAIPPPAWEPMGEGFDNTVYALERFNGATYAGGAFTHSGAAPVAGIARWNNTAWEPVGAGVNGTILALRTGAIAPNSIELIAAGSFTTTGGAPASRIARWVVNPLFPGSGSWSAMGPGFSATARAIERHANVTYAAGDFTLSGTAPVAYAARWTGSAWTPLGSGLSGPVYALKSFENSLYAAGAFTTAGGVSAPRVARWDGAAWHALAVPGINTTAVVLGAHQGELLIGGTFETVGPLILASPGWARYNPSGTPWVADHPDPVTRDCGQQAIFQVEAPLGYSALVTYRWRKDGVPIFDGPTGTGSSIAGAEYPSLNIHNIGPADEAAYDCVLTYTCASSTSGAAALTVTGCCYPDCNGSASLTIADFGCFQTKFVAGDPYADCNKSGSLTIADFACFQTGFVAGCP